MDLTKVMVIYMKGINFISLICIVIFSYSCTSKFTGETNEIVNKINQVAQDKKSGIFILKSKQLEILNGGLSPTFYKENYGKTIQSQEGEDIIFVEYNGTEILLQKLIIDRTKANFIHVSKNNFFRNDTIKMDVDNSGSIHITIH